MIDAAIVGTELLDESFAEHVAYWSGQQRDRVIDRLIEEMAELTQALMKSRRGDLRPGDDGGSSESITKELIDVAFCLEFLGRVQGIGYEEIELGLDRNARDLLVKLARLRDQER